MPPSPGSSRRLDWERGVRPRPSPVHHPPLASTADKAAAEAMRLNRRGAVAGEHAGGPRRNFGGGRGRARRARLGARDQANRYRRLLQVAAIFALASVVSAANHALAQAITEFSVPTAGSGPYGIASGPDGALWFTENSANNIGRITVAVCAPRPERFPISGRPCDLSSTPVAPTAPHRVWRL
jgi:hypothetical protein